MVSVYWLAGKIRYVPLYACDRCGFTSAAFRVDAAAAHLVEYPNCGGAIRIIFQAADRFGGNADTHEVDVGAAAPESQEAQRPAEQTAQAFAMREQLDGDGILRVTVLGELDLASADALGARLAELKMTGRPVRLDLSKLAFIDSSGVQALLLALTDARWHGWRLEVAREVSPTVERAAQIVGIAQVLWPPDDGTPGPRGRPRESPVSRSQG